MVHWHKKAKIKNHVQYWAKKLQFKDLLQRGRVTSRLFKKHPNLHVPVQLTDNIMVCILRVMPRK